MKHEDKKSLGFLPRSMDKGGLVPSDIPMIEDANGIVHWASEEELKSKPAFDNDKLRARIKELNNTDEPGRFKDFSIDTAQYNNEPNIIYAMSEDANKFTSTKLQEIVSEIVDDYTIDDKKLIFYLRSADLSSLRMDLAEIKYFTEQGSDLFGNHVMATFGFMYQGFTIEATYTPFNVQRLVFAGSNINKYSAYKYVNYVTFNNNGKHMMIILPEIS